jgi:FkbM family methyltransferase
MPISMLLFRKAWIRLSLRDILKQFSNLVAQFLFIAKIEGLRYAIRRLLRFLLLVMGVGLENEVVSTIRREAYRRFYNSFIDVGAFIGDTLLPTAYMFNKCIAVEPDPRSFPLLALMIRRLGLENCYAENVALADSSGYAKLCLARAPDQSFLIFTDQALCQETTWVKLETLDAIVKKHKLMPPYLIKIDVQGHEFYVLKGAYETLKRPCTVIMELWPYGIYKSGKSPEHVLLFMKKMGFKVYNTCGRAIPYEKLLGLVGQGQNNPRLSCDLVFKKGVD